MAVRQVSGSTWASEAALGTLEPAMLWVAVSLGALPGIAMLILAIYRGLALVRILRVLRKSMRLYCRNVTD